MTDPTNLARFAPNRCVSTQAAPTCSPTSAREREAQEIASGILAQAFSTLRIRVLKPQAIAQLRAEVQRTLAQRLTIRDWAA